LLHDRFRTLDGSRVAAELRISEMNKAAIFMWVSGFFAGIAFSMLVINNLLKMIGE